MQRSTLLDFKSEGRKTTKEEREKGVDGARSMGPPSLSRATPLVSLSLSFFLSYPPPTTENSQRTRRGRVPRSSHGGRHGLLRRLCRAGEKRRSETKKERKVEVDAEVSPKETQKKRVDRALPPLATRFFSSLRQPSPGTSSAPCLVAPFPRAGSDNLDLLWQPGAEEQALRKTASLQQQEERGSL